MVNSASTGSTIEDHSWASTAEAVADAPTLYKQFSAAVEIRHLLGEFPLSRYYLRFVIGEDLLQL